MGRDHRRFHRRAAQAVALPIITANVEILATIDLNPDLLGKETAAIQDLPLPTSPEAAGPSLPVAPVVPTAEAQIIPSVPTDAAQASAAEVAETAVPVDPSLPTPNVQPLSAVPINAAQAPAAQSLVPVPVPVPVPAPAQALPLVTGQIAKEAQSLPSIAAAVLPAVPPMPSVPPVSVPPVPSVPSFPSSLVVPSVPPFPQSSNAAHAQAISTSPFPTSPPASRVATAPSSAQSAAQTTARLAPSQTAASLSSLLPSLRPSSTDASDALSATASVTHAAYGNPGNPAAAPAATGTKGVSNASGSPAPLQTPRVVGSVVGSLAGAALLLAIVLFLLQRHKRRQRMARQLTRGGPIDSNQQSMTSAAPKNSGVPGAFLNRLSTVSRSTTNTSITAREQSFQRLAGRKLPSAFSEGMTSDQFSHGGTISRSSYYQDDQGTCGTGDAAFAKEIDGEFDKETSSHVSSPRASGPMNLRPGPARTPLIRHPDDTPPPNMNHYHHHHHHHSHLSPPQSPSPDLVARSSLGRSLYSADGSRASRFSENV